MRALYAVLGLVLVGVCVERFAYPQQFTSARGASDAWEQAAFPSRSRSFRFDVDRPDRLYYRGEAIRFRIRTTLDGYLYLFEEAPDHTIKVLFPNRNCHDNRVDRRTDIWLPGSSGTYRFTAGPPYGTTVFRAIVAERPLASIPGLSSPEGNSSSLTPDQLCQLLQRLTENSVRWEDASLSVRTYPRRLVAVVGVGEYLDPAFPDLDYVDRSAREVFAQFERYGSFQERRKLLNGEVTLGAVKRLLCRDLPAATQPGDKVLIYWLGHAGLCADQNGDEDDGLDCYLVVHDSQWRRPDTLLLDDTFGEWLKNLRGRHVGLIVDACHAADLVAQEKGGVLSSGAAPLEFHFPGLSQDLPGESCPSRTSAAKDISVTDLEIAVLGSARARQRSAFRGKLTAMTSFLLDYLNEAVQSESERRSGVTLLDVFLRLKKELSPFVDRRFGEVQQPFLAGGDAAARFFLIPPQPPIQP